MRLVKGGCGRANSFTMPIAHGWILLALLPKGLLGAEGRSPPSAPGLLTLDAAVHMALARTKDVVLARQDLLLADVEKVEALASILPSFDLSLSTKELFAGSPFVETRNPGTIRAAVPGGVPVFSYGPFVEAQANNYSHPALEIELSGRQLLYDGGKWWTVIARADDILSLQKAALRAVESDVRLVTARRFYELEKASRSVATFAMQIKVDEEQLERVRALLDAGLGKQNDVATVERNLAEDRITLARRTHAERMSRRALNLALGRDPDMEVTLSIDPSILEGARGDRVEALLPRRDLVHLAIARRPELERMRVNLEIKRKEIAIRRADFLPVVTLGASYARQSRKPARIFGDPTQNYFAGVDLTLRWNLFNGRFTSAEVERAEIELTKAEAGHRDLERVVAGEVEEKVESVGLFIEVAGLASEAIRSAGEAVRLARGLYEQGRGTLLELRDAELKLTLARLAEIEARLDLEIAREELRRAVGGEVPPGDAGGLGGRE